MNTMDPPLAGLDVATFRSRMEAALTKDGTIKHHEIYLSRGAGLAVAVERGVLKDASVTKEAGFGIRVANASGQSAFSHGSRFDAASIEALVSRTGRLMAATTPDPDFHGFAESGSGTNLDERFVFDPRIHALEPRDAIEVVKTTLDDARTLVDPRVYSINVQFSAGMAESEIFNSEGVHRRERSSLASLSCDVTVKDGVQMNSSYEYEMARMLDRVATPSLGSTAARTAIKTLDAVAIPSRPCPVVLSDKAVAAVLGASLGRATSAEALQQGASFLHGKHGERIAPVGFSLVDDGRHVEGTRVGTTSFDAEGSPTGKTVLIDRGVLVGSLHNAYTARKDCVRSTGNAARSGYDGPPGISTSNLLLSFDKGDGILVPREELFHGIDSGIFFDQTHDSVNLMTGDFSGMMSSAWVIENGEISSHVKQAAFGINLIDLLATIELVSKETRDRGGIICPAMRLSSLHVSGGI